MLFIIHLTSNIKPVTVNDKYLLNLAIVGMTIALVPNFCQHFQIALVKIERESENYLASWVKRASMDETLTTIHKLM